MPANKTNRKSKICSKCKLNKPLSLFWKRNRGFGDHDVRSTCKPCSNILVQTLRYKLKQDCVTYKGGKCERCGYCKCVSALDFHHKDPSKKGFQISDVKKTNLNGIIKRELDKCVLLCANCHREEHSFSNK